MKDEPEAIRNLYKLHTFGIKLGLERIKALLERMGNPERELAVIHVAGTNGKGSVCAILDSILRAAGYRTGIYTSPHLVRLNERTRVDGKCITDDEFLGLVKEVERHAKAIAKSHGEATFFEFTTAVAFEYFRRQNARMVVAETGMGGRLDATNVVMPLVSVITNISIEHAMYLGPDIASIAREKAGIIKQGRPVVCGELDETALSVTGRIAAERRCLLIEARDAVSVRRVSGGLAGQKIAVASADSDYGTIVMPLLGRHQLENCAIAVAAIEQVIAAGVSVDVEAVRKGISTVRWPGRCEVLSSSPLMILDGGHNPGAAERLSHTVKELAKKRPVGLIFGMCSDKDVGGFLRPFAGVVKQCWTVTISNERAVPRADLAVAAEAMGWQARAAGLSEALTEAGKWALENNGVVCIAGSLYLVGEVMELRDISPFD